MKSCSPGTTVEPPCGSDERFEKTLGKLSDWRNADHEDCLVLYRTDVIEFLEGVKRLRTGVAQAPAKTVSKYELAARGHGWVLKPNDNGGVFERCASDEPERVHLCGDWKQLCEFADINVAAFIPPTEADLKALRKKVADFILEVDPFGDRFSRREINLIEACSMPSTHQRPCELHESHLGWDCTKCDGHWMESDAIECPASSKHQGGK